MRRAFSLSSPALLGFAIICFPGAVVLPTGGVRRGSHDGVLLTSADQPGMHELMGGVHHTCLIGSMVFPRPACRGPGARAEPGDAGVDVLGERLTRRGGIANPPRQHATRIVRDLAMARLVTVVLVVVLTIVAFATV